MWCSTRVYLQDHYFSCFTSKYQRYQQCICNITITKHWYRQEISLIINLKFPNDTNVLYSHKDSDCLAYILNQLNFLGVIVDENLNWRSAISHVANKVSISVRIIRKSSFQLSTKSLRTLIYTFLWFTLIFPLQFSLGVDL